MKSRYYLLGLIVLLLASCKPDIQKGNFNIIPFPTQIIKIDGFSKIDKFLIAESQDKELENFLPWINTWNIEVESTNFDDSNFEIIQRDSIEDGAYYLSVKSDKILIDHSDSEGLANALSTLYQLLSLNDNKVPLVDIKDSRSFAYRGMHLDVARHMYSADEIKNYMDYLSFYKFNYFHWHLTDDQGWRIEIKAFPKIQEIASYRKETLIGHYSDHPHKFDGKKYGGFYSQEEIKDIVKYASDRGIEVVPEIDLPGHSSALLAAYPYLGCEDKRFETATKWGVFYDVLCPNEETFEFLEKVFDEVMDLFPSEYIHIGGDECPKEAWKKSSFCQSLMKNEGLKDEYELQSYFINRLENYISGKGRKIIGWDEILEGGLAPNATVMSWRGIEGGIEAANMNHDVIMTPTSHCYFDYYQSEDPNEPLAIGGYLPLEKVYNYNPIPEELDSDKHQYISGAQGNVWTEYLPQFSNVEYMMLSRSAALSEVLWSTNDKDFKNFSNRLIQHIDYWQANNVNISNNLLDMVTEVYVSKDSGSSVALSTAIDGTILYSKKPQDGKYASMKSSDVQLKEEGMYSFYAELDGVKGRIKELSFSPHKGNYSKISIEKKPAEKYGGNGAQSIINGIKGNDNKYGGSEWLGFEGEDFVAEIEFDILEKINSVACRFYKGEGQWIYLPSKVEILALTEEGEYQKLAITENINSDSKVQN